MIDKIAVRPTLIAAGIGLWGVIAPTPLPAYLILSAGAAYATRATFALRGIGRLLPAVAPVAVVLAAEHAQVKRIGRARASKMTVPKIAMTVKELRRPYEFGLERPSMQGLYYIRENLPEGVDETVVCFPSQELTLAQFIEAIEAQTPLEHDFMGCGNGGSSILFGENWALGLLFHG